MLTIIDLAQQDTRLHRASLREMAGPCPNPDCRCRNDGFHVDPQRNPIRKRDESGQWIEDETQPPYGGFRCRGCWPSEDLLPNGRKRGWGTPLDYLMHVRKMSRQQAIALLKDGSQTSTPSTVMLRQTGAYDYRSERWQEDTHATVQECCARLWDPSDTTALDYLHGRGFTDETIRRARLGYSLHGGIPRLIIPSCNRGQYVAIYRRDLRPDIPHDQRWKDAPGGTKSELYLADCLDLLPLPTILTEAPLDALSAIQTCRGDINVIATGGTNGARLMKWLSRLAKMPGVFVAFDADEAGDTAATWWLERLPNARRLRPLAHDLNAMLMQGHDLRQWILDQVEVCCVCERKLSESQQNLDLDFHFDARGRLYCMDHYQPAVEDSEPHKETREVPAATDEAADLDTRLEQFAVAVVRVAEVFPGPCKIYAVPPGYTIQDRARELCEEMKAREKAQYEQAMERQRRRLASL